MPMCKDSVLLKNSLCWLEILSAICARSTSKKDCLIMPKKNRRLLTQPRGNWIMRNMSVLGSSVIRIVAVLELTSAWKMQTKKMLKM